MKAKHNIAIAKAVLRRKLVIHAYIKKRKSQTTQLYTFQRQKDSQTPQSLGQTELKVSRRKKMTQVRAETNKIENRQQKKKSMKPRVGLKKVDKLSARLAKKNAENSQ